MSEINLTLTLPLTDTDRAVLKALAETGLGDLPPAPFKAGGYTPKPESVEDVGKAKPAPKAKAKPAPKAKPEPVKDEPAPAKPEPVEAAPAAEPEPAKDEPEQAKDEDGPGTSVDDAVARAAALLSEGKAEQVKAALAALDINRVSQLKPSQVEAFLNELG